MEKIKKLIVLSLFIVSFFLLSGQAFASQLEAMPPHPRLIDQSKTNNDIKALLERQSNLLNKGVDTPTNTPENSGAPSGSPVTPSAQALVLCIQFSDTTPYHSTSEFQNLLFGSSFGTLKDYYIKNSNGAFNLTGKAVGGDSSGSNQGTVFIKLPHPKSYYVDYQNAEGDFPNNSQGILVDAINILKSANFNFTPYEAGGTIPYLFMIATGNGAEYTGNSTDIWSHRWALGSHTVYVNCNGGSASVNNYSIEPELKEDGTALCNVGVFCHEFGHVLGLPDLYDTQNPSSSEGDGDWTVMAGGSWGGPNMDGSVPAEFDAFSKIFLGWYSPVILSGTGLNTSMQPIENSGGQIYRINPTTSSSEYYLLEDRQQTSYDQYLDGHGLLVWHIDSNMANPNGSYWEENTVNDIANGHYGIALIQADGYQDLEYGANRGDSSDPFPGTYAKTTLSDSTYPNCKLFNSGNSNISINNIAESGQNVSMVVGNNGSSGTGFSAAGSVTAAGSDSITPADSANDSAASKEIKDAPEETSATPITVGQTVNGTLSYSDSYFSDGSYYDLYSFNATAGQQFAITMSSSAFDTYLFLYNSSSSSPIAYNHDGGGGTTSRIPGSTGYWTAPTSGTYYIAANSYLPYKTGSYTLTLSSSTGGGTSNGISRVTMNFTVTSGSGTAPGSVQTGSDGSWNQSGFQSGSNYRVTPIKSGYSFNPAYLDFSSANSSLNFTGTPGSSGGGQVTAVTLTADKTSPQSAGTTVTFTAAATGSSSPLYQFWYEKPDGNWGSSGNYSSSNYFQLTNTATGTYKVIAYAKDAYSQQQSVESNVLQFVFNGNGGGGGLVTGVTLTSGSVSPQPAGTTVTFTATAAGSSNPLYQFWYKKPDGSWGSSGNYSSSNSFQLTNTTTGTYSVVAYAEDASNAQPPVQSNSVNFTFSGSGGGQVTNVTISANKASPQSLGTTVTFTASASGSSNPVYQFFIIDPLNNCTTGGSFSATNTYQLTGTSSGNYLVVVVAKDASGSSWQAFTSTAFNFSGN